MVVLNEFLVFKNLKIWQNHGGNKMFCFSSTSTVIVCIIWMWSSEIKIDFKEISEISNQFHFDKALLFIL